MVIWIQADAGGTDENGSGGRDNEDGDIGGDGEMLR